MMPNDDTRTIYGSGNDNWENINTEGELFHEIDDIVKNRGVEVLYQREPGNDIVCSLKENTVRKYTIVINLKTNSNANNRTKIAYENMYLT